MPYYQVYHGVALSDAQKDKIAGAITDAHSKQFHVLTPLVNTLFTDTSATSFYRGKNRKAGVNLILATTRNGDSRNDSDWETVCNSILAGWAEAVPDSKLDVCLILGAIIGGVESGFPIPKAGQDAAYLKQNFPKIQALADAGDVQVQEIIAEAKSREDYKWLFA